jgi:hypothetical protein
MPDVKIKAWAIRKPDGTIAGETAGGLPMLCRTKRLAMVHLGDNTTQRRRLLKAGWSVVRVTIIVEAEGGR